MASNQSNTTATGEEHDGAASLSYYQKTVCLQDWWLIKAEKDFEGRTLAIAGLTSRGHQQAVRVFSSAPILKRYDVFTLETVDGVCILIKGFINKARTRESGFSSEVFNHFVFGFPTYWEEYADKCFEGGTSNEEVARSAIGFHDFSEGSSNRSRKVIDVEQQNNSGKMDLNSGYGGLCDRQDDPCSLASVKDIEVPLSHVTSTCLMTDIQESNEGDIKTTVFGSEREQSEDFIIWNDNINQNFVSMASPPKKSDMGNSHGCKFTETVPVDTSGLDAKLSGKSSRSLERNDNVIDKDALISRSANFSTNLSFTSPEVVIANDGENLSGGGSTSSASGPRKAQKKSTKAGPTLESPIILGDSVTSLDHTVTWTKKQLSPKESPCATTDNTKSNRSRMKNLRLGEKMKQAAGCCLKYKDRTSTPASEPSEDLNEKKLNSISEVRTGWSEEQENILEEISPSEARKSGHLLTISTGKLKDDQRNVKLLGHEENNLSSGPADNTNTDGKQGQKCQGMMSKTAKQTKNMNFLAGFSIRLGDIDQKDELKIAVGKKETNAKKESNSGSKTKRKLTYESPVTRSRTATTSFVSPESLNIKRSRSGRLLMPALEFWRNQTAIYDMNRRVTGIREGDRGVETSRGSRSERMRKTK